MKKFELAMQTGLVPRTSDTGKDITLRNASEHKRLEGHLKHLDNQLRSKLVSMQAEIMELRASQYGQAKNKKRSPRLLEAGDRANSDGRLNQRKGRPRTFTNDKLSNTNSPLVSLPTTELTDQKVSKKELLFPEINTKQTSLVGLNPTKSCANDRISFLPSDVDLSKKKTKSGGLSPVDNVLLNIPSPSSIYRPNSLPDLSRLGSYNHGGGGGVSPRSVRRVQFTLPEKLGQNNVIPTENYKEPAKESSSSSETQNTLAERINEFCKQTETTKIDEATEETRPATEDYSEGERDGQEIKETKNINIDESDIFYNSMLAKANMENDLENTPDLASLGFMDFNDVIDKRLKQTQEELPTEDEMRKIRYLRWRQEAPQLDLVKTVFDKSNDLAIDGLNDLDADDPNPHLANDNDKDYQLNSSKS